MPAASSSSSSSSSFSSTLSINVKPPGRKSLWFAMSHETKRKRNLEACVSARLSVVRSSFRCWKLHQECCRESLMNIRLPCTMNSKGVTVSLGMHLCSAGTCGRCAALLRALREPLSHLFVSSQFRQFGFKGLVYVGLQVPSRKFPCASTVPRGPRRHIASCP